MMKHLHDTKIIVMIVLIVAMGLLSTEAIFKSQPAMAQYPMAVGGWSVRGAYTASGDQAALRTAASNETLYITDICMRTDAAQTITIKLGSTTVMDVIFRAAGNRTHAFTTPLRTSQGDDLIVNTGTNDSCAVVACGFTR
jgi:hypothetical protein